LEVENPVVCSSPSIIELVEAVWPKGDVVWDAAWVLPNGDGFIDAAGAAVPNGDEFVDAA
jgi:hypothetical protein